MVSLFIMNFHMKFEVVVQKTAVCIVSTIFKTQGAEVDLDL